MSILSIDRLLGLAGVSSTLANVSLLKRFLSGVAVVIAFTAISSTMAGMLLTEGFYALYFSLLQHGLDRVAAGIFIGGLALLVVIGFGIAAVMRWRELRGSRYLHLDTPVVSRVGKLAEAFLDGLLAERPRQD